MEATTNRRSWWRTLWCPYQRLWNRKLIVEIRRVRPRAVRKLLLRLLVLADTTLLWARAVVRRARRLGPAGSFERSGSTAGVPVLYFDMGLYQEAKELAWMVGDVLPRLCDQFEAYGFEAAHDSYQKASTKFREAGNVHIVHAALCHVAPSGGKLRLFHDGPGSSIYRDHLGEYEEVDAMRFSDWVRENKVDLEDSVCLLRMNIEGAEFDVVSDLIESGLAQCVDGYFGTWDDVAKIDEARGREFRAVLAGARIRHCAFNNRDLNAGWLRRKCIQYELRTSVRAGLRRVREARSHDPRDDGRTGRGQVHV